MIYNDGSMKTAFHKSKILWGIFFIVLIFGTASASYQTGYEKGASNPKTVIVRGVQSIDEGKPQSVNFNMFWEAWNILKDKHLSGAEVDDQNLVYGAIKGLFSSFDDPNTSFLPPSDAKKFGEDVSGEFSGIGADIGIRNEQLMVVAPLKDSPAERAGLKPKDKILKIDDVITIGLDLEEAVKRIRGQKGTAVTLTIARDSWNSPRDIKIERATIQVPTLEFKMLGDDGRENANGRIAHIHLFNFYERAPYEFYRVALQVAIKNPDGIILDLRNNPGGFLDAGIKIASAFLKSGEPVVMEELRGGRKEAFKAQGVGFLKDMPLVVLINEGSASASEIVAGALRDNRNVKLIGKKSFGKGTVQEVIDLRDDSLAKITIARWLTPKGHQIDKNGLAPDVDVEITDEDVERERDPQIVKAAEALISLIKRSSD